MSGSGTTPTGLVQRMKCAIGCEAAIPATQRFFVQGQHAQGDRHLNASRTRFIPKKLLGLFERTTWRSYRPTLQPARPAKGQSRISVPRMRGMWR